MKKRKFGPALYFASDKNVFDALVQKHKVDTPTMAVLFRNRNTLVSKATDREVLAEYFSRLTHDYYDHKLISEKIGITPRRERSTNVELRGQLNVDDVRQAIENLKKEVNDSGDVAYVTRDGDDFSLTIQYSRFDYKKSEFAQLVTKDAVIEFNKTESGYSIVSPQNEFANDVRDELVLKISAKAESPIEKFVITLFDKPSPQTRTKFFIDLIENLEGFSKRDVTDVYVYKPKPLDEDREDLADDDDETHIEKVLLRGNGVNRSGILTDLVTSDTYFIIKICWTTKRLFGNGDAYKLEASFADPKDCHKFSVLVKAVYPNVDGKFPRSRAPLKTEINELTKVIEASAKKAMLAI
ncbi:hypothetical protein [Pseudomonas putida]|uniref:hypothetical protein n=1 Tax=Pseudomonas putida TaxID=303 RepID=UPI0022DE6E31|nr:hypothetical protein [Pseudomonas putida]WBM44745.1 hypothetical protein M2J85_18610 [Pseudomonas putida]